MNNTNIAIEHFNRGVHLLHKEQYLDAISDFRTAIATASYNKELVWQAYLNIGFAYNKLKMYTQAIENVRKSLNLKKSEEGWSNLCSYLIHVNKIDEAIEAAKKSLKIKKKNPQALYHLGWAFEQQGNFEKALEFYKKSISTLNTDFHAWDGLARLFLDRNEIDTALKYVQEALKYGQNECSVLITFGEIMLKKNQLHKTTGAVNKALKLDKENGDAWALLGKILKKERKFDDSIEAFEKAITIKPDEDEFRDELQKIKSLKKKYEKEIADKKRIKGLNQLTNLMKVSSKVRLDMLKTILNLDDEIFNEKIIELAVEFNFKIDGEYILFESGDIESFIVKFSAD